VHVYSGGTASSQARPILTATIAIFVLHTICFSYPEGKRNAKGDCTEVKVKGSRIIRDDNTTAKLREGALGGARLTTLRT
jgi:hypothetical protein